MVHRWQIATMFRFRSCRLGLARGVFPLQHVHLEEEKMTSAENKKRLSRALEAFNDPDRREDYFQLYDGSAVLHRSPPLEPGLQSIKAWYRSLWAAFPDAHITLCNVVTEGDF